MMDTKIYGLARYYNNIGGLQDLYRLRQNQKLQDLDLRLNPVARNEPDYRLFLIHMLPNLRRLDDRAVRDSERKAALMHFSSDQAATLGEPPQRMAPAQEKQLQPRVEHVKSLAKPINVLEDDDVDLLDLIGRPGADMAAGITGSTTSAPQMQDYAPESVRRMNLAGVGFGEQPPLSADTFNPAPAEPYIVPTPISEREANLQSYPSGNTAAWKYRWSEALQQRYPNLPVIIATPPSPQHNEPAKSASGQDLAGRKTRVQFADDTNLKFQDEAEAYTAYKAWGQFTPTPGTSGGSKGAPAQPVAVQSGAAGSRAETASGVNSHYPPSRPPHQYEYDSGQPGVEFYTDKLPPIAADKLDSAVYQELPSTHSIAPSTITNASSMFHAGNTYLTQDGVSLNGGPPESSIADLGDPFVNRVSDLVDRYWNGAKSLQTNQKFQVQFNALLQGHLGSSLNGAVERDQRLAQLEEELTHVRAENLQLRERGVVPPELENTDNGKLKSMLIRAQRDLSILRSRLQMSMDENRNLQDRCANFEKDSSSFTKDGYSKVEELDQIRRENDNLRQEIAAMSGRMKQSGQLQELANMLQDSHKSLVQTNEHLLRELEEARSRHDQEVRQLHWNYDQLKAAVGYTPKPAHASSLLNGGGGSG